MSGRGSSGVKNDHVILNCCLQVIFDLDIWPFCKNTLQAQLQKLRGGKWRLLAWWRKHYRCCDFCGKVTFFETNPVFVFLPSPVLFIGRCHVKKFRFAVTLQCAPLVPAHLHASLNWTRWRLLHIKLSLPFMSRIEKGALRKGKKKKKELHVILYLLNTVQMYYGSCVSHQATKCDRKHAAPNAACKCSLWRNSLLRSYVYLSDVNSALLCYTQLQSHGNSCQHSVKTKGCLHGGIIFA